MVEHSRSKSGHVSNPEMVCLAEITSPHGVRGAVKVKTFTEYADNIFNYSELVDAKGKFYKLKFFAVKQNDLMVVTIDGVMDRDQAELLRGTKLYIRKDQLPPVEEGEFYYDDLVGLKVFSLKGEEIGTVHSVHNYGAGDYLEIRTPTHQVYTIPFRDECVPEVDMPGGKIVIDPDHLLA